MTPPTNKQQVFVCGFFYVEDNEVEKAKKIIKNAMESAVELEVPLVVNISSGTKWGSLN